MTVIFAPVADPTCGSTTLLQDGLMFRPHGEGASATTMDGPESSEMPTSATRLHWLVVWRGKIWKAKGVIGPK